ncbi:MAG: hypothetical protein RL762_1830 [Bacteroidota bacterium]|jgi:hypothetical protein
MKTSILTIALLFSNLLFSQTQGTLTLSFTQVPHTSYTGNKNNMAIWIQTSSGTFVKTRKKNAGGGTSDHLPIWAVNSGGSANNCMSGSCNTVGATTGATLNNFGNINVSWDGTDASGNLVPDGTYKITVESCWNHGNTSKASRSYTFTKGPNADIQSPTDDANFTGIALAWNPSGVGIEEVASPLLVSISPNPSSDGIFEVTFNNATAISVYNLAGEETMALSVVNEQKKVLNLSAMPNGVYFIAVTNGKTTKKEKVVINK